MRGGIRVITISLLGCSTSVALATGPTDEEEEAQAPLERCYACMYHLSWCGILKELNSESCVD